VVVGVLVGLLVVLGGLGGAAFAWSHSALSTDNTGLAQVSGPKFGGTLKSVKAYDAHGREVAVTVQHGEVYPVHKLPVGAKITVVAKTTRPGWVGWAMGDSQTTKLTLHTPKAKIVDRWPTVKRGHPLHVTFSTPVRVVTLQKGTAKKRSLDLATEQASVSLGRQPLTGTMAIAAAPRTWEKVPKPVTITWFASGAHPTAIVSPEPGTKITPVTGLSVTYAKLPKTLPTVTGATGKWIHVNSHTVRFRPSGAGFGLGTSPTLKLPGSIRLASGAPQATWSIPPGTTTRLQQLLADQGYLPLDFNADGDPVGKTQAEQVSAAVKPPSGSFDWQYDAPSAQKALWSPGTDNQVTQGALEAFQSDNGLTVDGAAGAAVWKTLIANEIAGKKSADGWSYVLVKREVPQSLTLWHNGKKILTTPVNTGVPGAPTEPGTFPVYQRYTEQTMSGTNPDGSHYSDPGIKWISYFNGGDALHGFDRASYGTPQSVGCVEMPVDEAAKVFPYTPIGTLVTIQA
jgi:lipoprotein-anchoring transpeptidase ErfK/SrfK